MYSETCTPASLPVEDGQEFSTLATLATVAGFQKQDGGTGRAALPDIALRWTATGRLEAERKFRRIKGFQELLLLQRTPESVTASAGRAGNPCCSVGIRESARQANNRIVAEASHQD